MSAESIRTAIITGAHGYDVIGLHELIRGLEGVDGYFQHMDDFAASNQAVREGYDVVLFFSMRVDTPTDEGQPWYAGKPLTALEHLGETQQGILVLHHALLSYPRWALWSKLTGISDRSFSPHGNQTIHVDVASSDHPITEGLNGWDMTDETYKMAEPGSGSRILLTTDHAKSMRALAWTREYKKSRVFCFACGHDSQTWRNSMFREVLRRGIFWCGRRLI